MGVRPKREVNAGGAIVTFALSVLNAWGLLAEILR